MSEVVRVLVVDDEALVRHALSAFLSGDDRVALVGEVTDGSEVVEACRATKPDVVLMDIKMAEVGGVEATKRVLEWNPRCRVVAIIAAHAGDRVVSPEVQEMFVRAAIESADGRVSDAPALSDRERLIIELIAKVRSHAQNAFSMEEAFDALTTDRKSAEIDNELILDRTETTTRR